MDDPKHILTLLGISCENISHYSITTDGTSSLIKLELKDLRQPCPNCGSRDVSIKDYYTRYINDTVIKHQNVVIEVRQRRYICNKCHKSYKQRNDFIEDKASISNATKLSIIEDLKERRTIDSIAKEHNVSPTTVVNILDKGILYQTAGHLPECLNIDEFHFVNRKALGKYPAVLSNYFTGEIIDIIPSRRKDYLFEYFNKVKVNERNNVKFFISDMNESYRTLKRAFFRDAIHIIDMFHITKLFTEAIQVIRKRIMKREEYDSKEYRFLKKNWKLFLMHQDALKARKRIDKQTGEVFDLAMDVNFVLKHYPDLNTAYQIYDDFYFKSRHPMYWKDADNLLNFIINKCANSLIPDLEQVGRSLKHWQYEICNTLTKNSYGIRLSNAVAEANNNNIQTLIDLSYGLLNFERTRKRILLIARNKKTREH